jgi:branched-chain amino acid transport system substrate-binding protein
VGILHPVTGALAYSGQQCREGALMAIEDINKTGIKSLGGAKIETLLGDAQSTPQAGAAEIEKMNEAGCSAVVGAYASAICLATTQAAAKYNLPHVVDVGVAPLVEVRRVHLVVQALRLERDLLPASGPTALHSPFAHPEECKTCVQHRT